MATLQVQLDEEQMEVLRLHAKAMGKTMKAVIAGWIDGINEEPLQNQWEANGASMVLMERQVELLSSLERQSMRQTELLERLAAQGTGYGGTECASVDGMESEDVRSESFAFDGFEPQGGVVSVAGDRRSVEASELKVGLRVWVKRWQAWGVVEEEPVGDGGPAYVRKDGESIAEHVSAGQLEVAKEAA